MNRRSPEELCKDFLSQVYKFLNETMIRYFSSEMMDHIAITYCFTTSPTWPVEATSSFRDIATAAGFSSRPKDSVRFVGESEAAGLAVLTQLDIEGVEPIKVRNVRSPPDMILTVFRMMNASPFASVATSLW